VQGIGYYFAHPEVVIYPVATVLFYPVLLLLAYAMFYNVFELGVFTVEMFRRDRKRSSARIESAATLARLNLQANQTALAVKDLGEISRNWLVVRFIRMLGDGSNMTSAHLIKTLGDTEMLATKRIDRTRVWIRLGPIIGLITTLIPISPALVALAKGDMQVLSANLVIAFSTTVIALFVSGVAFVISMFRERAYIQDVGDIEYALELLEV
jgi:biopolymer transport protein ExbB/TolQ